MQSKGKEENDARREVIWRSCFTTILIFVTIIVTMASIFLKLSGIGIDYKGLADFWFISLVVLYSIDLFILKRYWWPRSSAKRKKDLRDKYLERLSHQK